MSVAIWIILSYVFIKCLGWVLAPFLKREDEEEESIVEGDHYHHYNVRVEIHDSFNTDNSSFKGGAYYGTKEENSGQTSTDYFGSKYTNRF